MFHQNEELQALICTQEHFKELDKGKNDGENPGENNKFSILLNSLMKATNTNVSRCKTSNRFEANVKQFATYLFIVGGRLVYETLYANLPRALPSISTVSRYLNEQTALIEEGLLRVEELKNFLIKRNLPMRVWICEDGTKITGRIQYNSENNKIVGFVIPLQKGLPIQNHFEANTAKQIFNYFKHETRADYAYLVMAQPLSDKCPPFTLTIFGTDNRFTNQDVEERWKIIQHQLAQNGIEAVGYSTDGDSRCLKTMRNISTFLEKSPTWDWFNMNLDNGEICVQDTVHIGTKLRTRLLNSKKPMPMGCFQVEIKHIQEMMEKVRKDKHFLTKTDIEGQDKMNFKAVQKLSAPCVSQYLQEHVENSSATIIFLKLIRKILSSFLEKDCDIKSRLQNIWYATFFLRIWRSWIKESREFTLFNNFISLNAYLCIELNAHALIKLIRKYRTDNSLNVDFTQFPTWLFSSQPCEQTFRATRSMSSTFSTIVNFSMMDILSRVRKIETILKAVNDLSDLDYIFPREKKTGSISSEKIEFPSDTEINAIVLDSLIEVFEDCKVLNISVNDEWKHIHGIKNIVNEETEEEAEDLETDNFYDLSENINETSNETLTSNRTALLEERAQTLANEVENAAVEEPEEIDMLELNELNFEDHCLDKELNNNSPYVHVLVNNKTRTIRKSSLCWLFNDKHNR